MAEKNEKVAENAPGKWYVDSNCIDCDVCRTTAPENFMQAEGKGYSFVFKQPANEEELKKCREAKDTCPVEAIGDDG